MLRPATITVLLHETIETKGMRKEDVPALKERVRKAIADPVEDSLAQDTRTEAETRAETALRD
jgi:hypothetical protein